MTHDEVVKRAVRWLLNSWGCSVAFSEFATSAHEVPDAIGFRSRWSVIVECKTSRADFFADSKKIIHRGPELAMGAERYYMVPAGLISPDELPPRWGLLYIQGRHTKMILKSGGFAQRHYMSEIGFLVSMLRRIKIRVMNEHQNAVALDCLNQWIKSKVFWR